MARKPPTQKQLDALKVRQIKKGEVRNPLGAGAHNQALKALKKFGQKEYGDIIEFALTNNRSELKKVIIDPDTSVLKLGVAKSLLNAVDRNDWNIINQIAERLVGKQAQQIEFKQTTDLSNLSDDDLEKVQSVLSKYSQPNENE
jgi:hypothetical protein